VRRVVTVVVVIVVVWSSSVIIDGGCGHRLSSSTVVVVRGVLQSYVTVVKNTLKFTLLKVVLFIVKNYLLWWKNITTSFLS